MKEFKERGFFHQCTNEHKVSELLEGGVTAYIGFDCTADSLHVGSLVQIMILRWLKRNGHKAIILLGEGTTLIGDPSGRDSSRPILTEKEITKNANSLRDLLSRFGKFQIEYNNRWVGEIDFLKLGKHITISKMLSFDSVKIRENLTLAEFLYMIVQGNDFAQLARQHNCALQIGGSDQWGNIVNGIELARRIDGRHVYGLTTPLIMTANGEKMGKTVNGAIWLSASKTSSYDYWQFWRNTKDEDVGKFLRLFTELDISEIKILEKLKDAEINDAKIILANEATKICHGSIAATEACQQAQVKFKAK